MTVQSARQAECFGDLLLRWLALLVVLIKEHKMNKTQKRKLILIAIIGFCALMLLDWSGMTGRGFPVNGAEALLQICINIGWTALFTVVNYFALIRPLRRSNSAVAEHCPHGSDPDREGGDHHADPRR